MDLGDHSVSDVKLNQKMGFAHEQQKKLFFCGSQLENGKKLEDSGVQIGSTCSGSATKRLCQISSNFREKLLSSC